MSLAAPPSPVDEHPPLQVRRRYVRGRHPKLTAVVAAVVGALSTAVGAGIGVRHLTKTGLTGRSALGMALLLLGLVLLAHAIAVFWRTARRWQRLWLVPFTVVALLGMIPVAVGTMLGYAPRTALGSVTPASRGLIYQDVTFRTGDGVRLAGWYVPSTSSAAIVVAPGAGSTRTATLGQADVLVRHGYAVLLVDPRGQGRSGGRAMDAGWYGDRDLTAAVTFLQRQPGIDPSRIGVLGLSMGGEEAIGAARADPAIRVVVAEGATHRTAADKAGWLPGGVNGGLQRAMDRITYGVAALASSAPEPRTLHAAISGSRPTPFMLIAAGEGVDEPEAAAYLRSAAPDRVQVWTVPGASHTHGLTRSPAEWTARVTSFLDRTLGGSR